MSKYRSKKCEADGYKFDSMRERQRYYDLKLLVKAHAIEDLELQPKFPIVVNGVKVCVYIADFRYRDRVTGEVVTEDVKGFKTPVYNLKKKLVKAVHGITIEEI